MCQIRISLVMITLALIALGIIMIYSASSIYAWNTVKDSAFFLKKHIFFLSLGIIASLATMAIDYKILKSLSKPAIILAVFLLTLVLIPGIGREAGGAQRWLKIGEFSFQPSEFAYLALIIYLADFFSRKQNLIKNFLYGFMPVISVLAVLMALILLQPDLGTTIALGLLVLIMLFVAGARTSYITRLFLISLPALYLLIFRVPYRRMRMIAFLNPWADPRGSGFQIIQSQIAFGNGGIFGVGLGRGIQKLFYLPASHTDFIFSIIGEELGLLGTLGVVILFIHFLYQALKIVRKAQDKFGYFLSLGVVLMIMLRVVVNIAVSIGLFPTKGLPLPFISYGGSSLISDMIGVSLLLNISRFEEYA